jgi:hypothetical protein
VSAPGEQRRSSAFPSPPVNGALFYLGPCSNCGMDGLMATRQGTDHGPAHMLRPMHLRIGDRFTDLDGKWEIAGGR